MSREQPSNRTRSDRERREAAFKAYYAMGTGGGRRTLRGLASQTGIPQDTLKKWSKDHEWAKRIEKVEDEAAAAADGMLAKETARVRAAQLRALRIGADRLSKKLERPTFGNRTNTKDTVTALATLIKMDRLLCGESTANVATSHEDALDALDGPEGA